MPCGARLHHPSSGTQAVAHSGPGSSYWPVSDGPTPAKGEKTTDPLHTEAPFGDKHPGGEASPQTHGAQPFACHPNTWWAVGTTNRPNWCAQ